MVAYSFKSQFAMPIINGTKLQTIRAQGKRRHARPGEPLQLYTGMRTKHCHKIIEPDPVCDTVIAIEIAVEPERITSIHLLTGLYVGGTFLGERAMEKFAKHDGFTDLADMHKFWLENHGAGHFKGVLITWRNQE